MRFGKLTRILQTDSSFTDSYRYRFLGPSTLLIPIPIFRYEYHTDTDTNFLANTDMTIPILIISIIGLALTTILKHLVLHHLRQLSIIFVAILSNFATGFKQSQISIFNNIGQLSAMSMVILDNFKDNYGPATTTAKCNLILYIKRLSVSGKN